MQIVDAEISGFKLHRTKRSFDFGRINRISGGNGKGKTTISEAIAWCFYGCDLSGRTKDIFDRLKNAGAKETKVVIGVEMPSSDGTLTRYDFCRIRKGKVTSLYLNGHDAKQYDFDGLLGPMELFLSIFVPGYFGTIAITEPTNARNLLVSMLPKLNHADVLAKLDEEDQVRIELLDMINPDLTLKNLRSEINELEKSLKNIQGKIDYLRIQSMLDVPMRIVEEDVQYLNTLKEEFTLFIAGGDQVDQHDLSPLLGRQAELRFMFDERYKKFKLLKSEPLPKAGDQCPACRHAHTEAEAQAEFSNRRTSMIELQQQCEAIKQEGIQLAAEIDRRTNDNKEAMRAFQEERGRTIAEKQAEIESLTAIVNGRAAKLKMAKDLDEQHEIYGETVSEAEEKKVSIQSLKNFMLQYVEMQVAYVNSFMNLAKIQLFKYSGTTGEMMLDFSITYGEEQTAYSSLSNSEKIRCSIELAGLLNRVQNKTYPVYIDNAESIEAFDEPGTQYFVAEVVKKADLRSEIVA
ncbi:AAA family ATPase [Paenibacillus alkaliterrae]|uniref:AAA family ATPase n=1 Tax=Paenibacillus alkaliterrae TaxID=320909 RepID=UPI001F2F2A60|nr:AAA family ATPase [Paenibacillus alkaliterrae]MCF2941520.1 AAA family ATPase [Paenibacillus alkaliterrae]